MSDNAPVPAVEPGRILVVDDNQDNIEIIATRLRYRGYEILEAGDGEQALALVREAAPDLILLDLHLPDLPGRQVLRRLRSYPETRDVPVFVVTADASHGVADSFGFRTGVNELGEDGVEELFHVASGDGLGVILDEVLPELA